MGQDVELINLAQDRV